MEKSLSERIRSESRVVIKSNGVKFTVVKDRENKVPYEITSEDAMKMLLLRNDVVVTNIKIQY